MKMNKRLLSMILVVVMVLGMIPLNAIATDETDPIQVTHLDTCVDCTNEDGTCQCACHQVMVIDDDPTVPCTLCDGIFAADGETVIHNPTCLTKCSCTPVDGVHVAPCVLAPAAQEDEGGEEDPLCDKCNAVKNEDGTLTHEATCEFAQSEEPLCNMCEATKDENGKPVHADGCKGPCECEAVIEGYHSNMECPYYVEPVVPEKTLTEKLLEIDNLSDLLIGALEDEMALMELTLEEVNSLRARAEELYAAIENPTSTDADDLDGFLAVTEMIPSYRAANECPDCFMIGGHTEDCPRVLGVVLADLSASADVTWSGNVTYSSGTTTWTFSNGATAYLKAPCTIKSGATLRIIGYGSVARHKDNTSALIVVEDGGKLIIQGRSMEEPLIIDGKNVIANIALIKSYGTLELTNAVIQNGKNRSVDTNGSPNGNGGGIIVNPTGYLSMTNSVVTCNTASLNGGGIMCYGDFTITNSEITLNRAASAETNEPKVGAGRGGGIYLSGEGAEGTLEKVKITNNAAMYYGGGVQVSSSAKLTMNDETVINDNEAILHGAGGVHLTAQATFIMNNGEISNNKAQTVGGAIHSSHGCTLELNGGEIKGNIANGRGGGVHLNTGCSITLNKDITISGNKVYNKPTGTHADMDATGDNWSNVRYEGPCDNNGYGGGVLIDAGTCTVNGATITDNYAEVGGGGIALVMLNVSNDNALRDLRVVNFTMTSGTVSGNKTSGNGAGVYMMSNKIKEGITTNYGAEGTDAYNAAVDLLHDKSYLTQIPQAVVSGGTINNNIADENGGGLYLEENTEFHISGTGDISNNTAVDGAGVYIAKGTAEINGGTIQSNTASGVGGGLYVLGNVTMTDGVVQNNTAVGDGGALYITSDTTNDVIGNFIMTSGKLLNNKAGNGENLSNGGGAYVFGGNITIGVPACEGDTTEGTRPNHTVEPMNKIHPLIQGNTATDSGGGLALIGSGNITMYCGNITNNDATNRGRGLNVYMEEGKFDYHNGDVGALESPELVIVGGTLVNNKLLENGDIKLKYYHCNDTEEFPGDHTGDLEDKIATATKLSKFNLPDGEKYWDAPDGYRFFGWTFYGPNNVNAPDHVRNKDHYKPMGEPIVAQDVYDGIEDNIIEMYALWAPETSSITYVGNVINGTFTNEALSATNQATYSFSISDYNIVLNSPVKSGYTFLGWYYYQNENQNANWGNEPQYKEGTTDRIYANLDYSKVKSSTVPDGMGFLSVETSGSNKGKCILPVEATNFGDITLIAKFKPAFTTLTITKSGANTTVDPNQSFVFNIKGEPYDDAIADIDMDIVITGNGTKTIEYLPVGSYTVTEVSDWSWRYTPDDTDGISVNAENPDTIYPVSFANSRTENKWLDGDSICRNWFNGSKFEAN